MKIYIHIARMCPRETIRVCSCDIRPRLDQGCDGWRWEAYNWKGHGTLDIHLGRASLNFHRQSQSHYPTKWFSKCTLQCCFIGRIDGQCISAPITQDDVGKSGILNVTYSTVLESRMAPLFYISHPPQSTFCKLRNTHSFDSLFTQIMWLLDR